MTDMPPKSQDTKLFPSSTESIIKVYITVWCGVRYPEVRSDAWSSGSITVGPLAGMNYTFNANMCTEMER